MKKRFLSILLALSMVLTFLPLNAVTAFAEDAPARGKCGENLTWTLDSNGTLTISGTGAMGDYNNANQAPWYDLRSKIKQVILEDGVTSIGDDAFYSFNEYDYSNLERVSIPDSVTSIGSYAFKNCISLNHVKIPDGVTSIPWAAFANCYILSDITLPKNLTDISDDAFRSCFSLKSIVIPDGVTGIGSDAFYECIKLTNVTLPKNLTRIARYAFHSCSSLTNIVIPDGVTSIGENAFYDCSSLTNVTIPGSVTSISSLAFSGCPKLSTIRYLGTQDQWETLKQNISADNESLFNITPTFVSSLTVKNGSFTCLIDGKKVTESPAMVPSGTKVTVTFDKAAFADSSSKFSYWDIDGLDNPNTYQNQESFTFTMPDHAVTLEAMTQDDSIDDAVAEVLGTAAMVTTAVAGTAVLAYTGYQIGTELYLTYLLPTGAAIPANAAQLAQLLWTEAGKPAPAAVLPEDAAETQQAMAWAVEQNLLPADKAPDASVSRIEVIRTWKKAQSGKVG